MSRGLTIGGDGAAYDTLGEGDCAGTYVFVTCCPEPGRTMIFHLRTRARVGWRARRALRRGDRFEWRGLIAWWTDRGRAARELATDYLQREGW